MPSAFENQLVAEMRRNNRSAFDEAVLNVTRDFLTADSSPGPDGVPLDSGNLRDSWSRRNRSVTTDLLRVTVAVKATNDGTDYGAILNYAKRIEPKKAKYLRFQPPGSSDFVFSKGFDNRWHQWWSTWWGGLDGTSTRWREATEIAIERAFNR